LVDIPGGEYGAILFSDLTAATADAVIAEQIRFFTGHGLPFEWKLYGHDRPTDLGDRLAGRGFRPGDRETLLCGELSRPFELPPPSGVTIRKLESSADLDFLVQLDEQIGRELNRPLLSELRMEMAATPPAVSVYIALIDGKPVSRAWVRFYPQRDFADLWGGETLPAFRRRGIYRSLVSVRWEEARRRKIRYLTTDAMPTSRPILEKIGFRPLTWTAPYLYLTF
jgi:GNAT superfamily N-acetyltransferase